MNANQTMRYSILPLVMLVFCPLTSSAVGFRLPNQDPDAIARGNAFVATADNPSAIYYNPAGITQLQGQEFRAGLYLVSGGITYDTPSGNHEFRTDSSFQPVPQAYFVLTPENLPLPLSFGLGVYAPYGLSIDWGTHTTFNTIAEKGVLQYATVNPVVAWKVLPTLSIAAGPTINYSYAKLEKGIGFIPGDQFTIEGDGWAYGFNAGFRWQPTDQLSFGVNYRYATDVEYDGTSTTTPRPAYPPAFSSSASIHFPQFVVGGVSWRPTEDWNLEADLDWTDWDSVHSIVFHHTAFGNQTLLLNYRSSFMYEFGVTRQLGKGFFGSVGFFFSENSSPDKNFNPIVPDTDLELGSVGIGYRGKRWDWSFAYHFGYDQNRTVKGSTPNPFTGQSADGSYHVFNNGLNIAATLKF